MKAKAFVFLASSGLATVIGWMIIRSTALGDAACYMVQPDGQVVDLDSMCSPEVYEPDSEQDRNSPYRVSSLSSTSDCTKNRFIPSSDEARGLERSSDEMQNDAVVVSASSNVLLDEAAIDRIPRESLEALEELVQSNDEMIDPEIEIISQEGGEVIYENRGADVITITPEGIVSCDGTDEFTNVFLGSSDEERFYGGPYDNQRSRQK